MNLKYDRFLDNRKSEEPCDALPFNSSIFGNSFFINNNTKFCVPVLIEVSDAGLILGSYASLSILYIIIYCLLFVSVYPFNHFRFKAYMQHSCNYLLTVG